MTQLGLEVDPPYEMPPITRWCLVGEPASSGAGVYRLTEYGTHYDEPAAIAPPTPADSPWLGAGVGTQLEHRDGIAGFVWFLTMECDRARAQRTHRPRRSS